MRFTLNLVVLSIAPTFITAGSALAGPPFRADDPQPVDYQHWEVYGFSQSTRVSEDSNGTLFGVEINYGAAPDLQLHIVVPLAFDDPTGGNWQTGVGDTEFGAKYRFVQEDDEGWRPMVGVFPMVELSTGDAKRGLGAGYTRVFLPVWLQKSFGDWQTYGGGGYWINPGTGHKNYCFMGWLLQRKITDQLTLGGEIFHQTADTTGGSDSTGFNVGGFFDFTENHHLLFSAGKGLQNAGSSNRSSYYVGYQLTF